MSITLSIIGLLRLLYFKVFWTSPNAKSDTSTTPIIPYEIIVCAKNEYANLLSLIPLLLNQSLKPQRITIVDDYSTDDTSLLKSQYPELNWIHPSMDVLGKKLALSEAIEQCPSDFILLTDADCRPGIDWALWMLTKADDADAVLGYSPYTYKNDLLTGFVSFETFVTAAQYLSFCQAGRPYMGVGRNLLIKTNTFKHIGGYSSHIHHYSGDDDLLIQDLHDAGFKISCQIHPASWVSTTSPQTWALLWRQKLRHNSAAMLYNRPTQVTLGLQASLHILWVLTLLVGMVIAPIITLGIMAIYYYSWVSFIYPWTQALHHRPVYMIPFYDIFQGLWNLALGITGSLKTATKW